MYRTLIKSTHKQTLEWFIIGSPTNHSECTSVLFCPYFIFSFTSLPFPRSDHIWYHVLEAACIILYDGMCENPHHQPATCCALPFGFISFDCTSQHFEPNQSKKANSRNRALRLRWTLSRSSRKVAFGVQCHLHLAPRLAYIPRGLKVIGFCLHLAILKGKWKGRGNSQWTTFSRILDRDLQSYKSINW